MGQVRMEGKVEKELGGVEGDNHNHHILLEKNIYF